LASNLGHLHALIFFLSELSSSYDSRLIKEYRTTPRDTPKRSLICLWRSPLSDNWNIRCLVAMDTDTTKKSAPVQDGLYKEVGSTAYGGPYKRGHTVILSFFCFGQGQTDHQDYTISQSSNTIGNCL
jgi:hypothetical protein